MLRLAIAIPTYNESKNIESLIRRIHDETAGTEGVEVTVVVLDDSSPDGTADVVRALAPELKRDNFDVRVIVKETKAGLGAAYINGFRILGSEGFDYILQMDADLSHDPVYVPRFIEEALKGTDLVVGSRYIPGGATPDWTWNRKFLSRGGNIYARTVLSRRVTDYTGGFNMFSRELLERVKPEEITATGYGFILVLKYRALRASRSYAEIPIVFMDRTHGSSKMPKGTLLVNFVLVPRLRWSRAR